MKRETDSQRNDDLRSIKSEYDYGSKKKFVDVLGNVSGHMKNTSQNGLKGLEALRAHEGNKHLDSASQRSRLSKALSNASSLRRRQNNMSVDIENTIPIPEEMEI